jgi:2-aminoethylphosphonate-pyruvate transaminase
MPHTILLNPGPVNLSDRVRMSLLKPDLCHREIEFSQLQEKIRARLLEIYDLDPRIWTAVLLTGSGTAAMEAMLSSLVPHQGKILILENGVYGERLSKIATIYGLDRVSLSHSWGEKLTLPRIIECLDRHGSITHLAVVHHETTTGRLNDLEELGAICRERNLEMLIDGVSSFGGEELQFEQWGITACAATANKCLHAIPGACFVIVRRAALMVENRLPRTLYLDLASYCQEQDRGGTPFTQSVQSFYALAEALEELFELGGWKVRHQYYKKLASLVREGLVALGVKPLMSPENSSVVLNSYYLPAGISYERLHHHLKDNGYVIYAGQGELARSIFRISTMGQILPEDLERFLKVVEQIII